MLPHVLVLVAAWLGGVLPDFVYDAFQFVQAYYSQYLMNPSPLGILRDWQAQYRLRSGLAARSIASMPCRSSPTPCRRRRAPSRMVRRCLAHLFVALTHVRTSGMSRPLSHFSLAIRLGRFFSGARGGAPA